MIKFDVTVTANVGAAYFGRMFKEVEGVNKYDACFVAANEFRKIYNLEDGIITNATAKVCRNLLDN